MSSRSSFGTRRAAASIAAALFVAACHEAGKPTAPDVRESAANSTKYTLKIGSGSSTASGSVSTNRGGISCTINASSGTATTSGSCSQKFKIGTVVTATAAPASSAVLASWQGCTATSDNPLACQVTMDQDRNIAPTFTPPANTFKLTISGGASASGTVKTAQLQINCTITNGTASGTCSAYFPTGVNVTLTAAAASGSYLKAWAGGGCDASGTGRGTTGGSCTVAMSRTQDVVVSFDAQAVVASMGHWDAPINWPAVAIHSHLLSTGKVMTWGLKDHVPVIWDPANPLTFGSTTRPVDFFCSGHGFLPDGRLLVAGGHSGTDNKGILSTVIFDPVSSTWSSGPDMQNGRWYPTNTTLANGDMLTVSGGDTAQQRNLIPEVYHGGSWRALDSASLYLPYFPFMFVAPDGRVFDAGPSAATHFLNTASRGQWTNGPSSNFGSRDYGSAVMYDGKIMIVGGGTPTATAEVIDLSAGAAAAWHYTVNTLSVPRRQTNATIVADGKVLVTGGTNATGFNNAPTSSAVLAAELFDPVAETFKALSRQTHYRLYHSTALLLPDGRVLSVGSGAPAASGLTDDYTAEIFSPPYLFKLDGTLRSRPTISGAPTSIAYGQAFAVQTPDASSIGKVTFIRLSSVTHAFNQQQRLNTLTFSASGATSITVTAPASHNLAPPGYYLLFIVKSDGTPSVGTIVKIS